MRTAFHRLAVALAVAAPILDISAQTATTPKIDNFIGTWILNVALSRYESGPLPKGGTRAFDYTADGKILSTRTGVGAGGELTFGHWIAAVDGTEAVEYSRAGSGPPVTQTVMFRYVDPYTILLAAKRDGGRLAVTGAFTVSKDGKKLTQSVLGIDREGRRYSWDNVYDKQ